MLTPSQPSLLRRTTAVVSAVFGLLIAAESTAATVTLGGTANVSCSYDGSVTVTPSGGLSINCTTGGGTTPTPPPPPPPPTGPQPGAGTFAFTQSSVGATPNQIVDVAVARTNGSTGSFNVPWATAGAGCGTFGGTLSVAEAVTTGTIQVQMGMSGQCTAYLQTPVATGATTGVATVSSAGVAVTVNGATVPVSPPPVAGQWDTAGCAAGYSVPGDVLGVTLGGYGNPLLQMQKSQQVVAIKLPALGSGTHTGVVQFGESAGGAYTPQPVTVEISINKCPGVVLPESDASGVRDYCNLRSTNGNYNAITWFGSAYGTISNKGAANAYGYCWAGDAGSSYYINARWTYQSCAFGVQICGFAIQQNQGPY